MKESKVTCTLNYCKFEAPAKLGSLVDHCKNIHKFRDIPCTFSNCNFVAFNHAGYAFHTSTFHSKNRVFSGNEFKCPYKDCRSVFTRKINLERHVRVHENNLHACIFCPYRTASEQDIADHYRSHYKIRDYKCALCESSFVKLNSLRVHEENFHRKGEIFHCQFCDYTGTRKTLQVHLRSKHKMSSQFNKVTKSYDTFEKWSPNDLWVESWFFQNE